MESKHVWVADPEFVWKMYSVTSDNLRTGELRITDNKGRTNTTVLKSSTVEVIESDLQDLVELDDIEVLNEAPILDLVRRRYQANKYFLFARDMLLFVNPNRDVSALFANPASYYKPVVNGDVDEPHLFGFTNRILQSFLNPRPNVDADQYLVRTPHMESNKTIILQGRAGSGKTESAKNIAKFLLQANAIIRESIEYETQNKGALLSDVDVVLEAFGNASTINNTNASRFSKFTRYFYASNGSISSIHNDYFNLERKRVASVNENERNYHVFYQLVVGLNATNPSLAGQLRLTNINNFRILNRGTANEADCVARFTALVGALQKIGCSEVEIESIWKLLAVILHMGNIEFSETQSIGSPSSSVDYMSCSSCPVSAISNWLGIDNNVFTGAVANNLIIIANKRTIPVGTVSVENSRNNIEACMRHFYWNLFKWLTRKINFSLWSGTALSETTQGFIGVLDLSGFENLQPNNFGQLCVNYAEEMFQQQYFQHMLLAEQSVYAEDRIAWNHISHPSNDNVIEVLTRKTTGVFAIIEEHCMMTRTPEDRPMLKALNVSNAGKPGYQKPRFGSEYFIIKHFEEDVKYSIDSFLWQNNETVQSDISDELCGSSNIFVRAIHDEVLVHEGDVGFIGSIETIIVQEALNAGSAAANLTARRKPAHPIVSASATPIKGAVPMSNRRMSATAAAALVSNTFKEKLNVVLTMVKSSDAYYVKCFRPNAMLGSSSFSASHFLSQYKASGVSSILSLHRIGYEFRLPFLDFIGIYGCLQNGGDPWQTIHSNADSEKAQNLASAILQQNLDSSEYRMGDNYVFLTAIAVEDLFVLLQATSADTVHAMGKPYLAIGLRSKKLSSNKGPLDDTRRSVLRQNLIRDRARNDELVAAEEDSKKHKIKSRLSEIIVEKAKRSSVSDGSTTPMSPGALAAAGQVAVDISTPASSSLSPRPKPSAVSAVFGSVSSAADAPPVIVNDDERRERFNAIRQQREADAKLAADKRQSATTPTASKGMSALWSRVADAKKSKADASGAGANAQVAPSVAAPPKVPSTVVSTAPSTALARKTMPATGAPGRRKSNRRQSAAVGGFHDVYGAEDEEGERDDDLSGDHHEELRGDDEEESEEGDNFNSVPEGGFKSRSKLDVGPLGSNQRRKSAAVGGFGDVYDRAGDESGVAPDHSDSTGASSTPSKRELYSSAFATPSPARSNISDGYSPKSFLAANIKSAPETPELGAATASPTSGPVRRSSTFGEMSPLAAGKLGVSNGTKLTPPVTGSVSTTSSLASTASGSPASRIVTAGGRGSPAGRGAALGGRGLLAGRGRGSMSGKAAAPSTPVPESTSSLPSVSVASADSAEAVVARESVQVDNAEVSTLPKPTVGPISRIEEEKAAPTGISRTKSFSAVQVNLEFTESIGSDVILPAFQQYRLRKRVRKLFQRCSAGDIHGVHALLCANPSDQFLIGRSEYISPVDVPDQRGIVNLGGQKVVSRFLTLPQAALISGQVDMLEYLEVTSKDILQSVHFNGSDSASSHNPVADTLIHFGARINGSLSTIKYLVDVTSLVRDIGDISTPSDALADSVATNAVIKQGWMYKKDSTRSWSLKFVTLTDQGIKYAKTEDTNKFKDFLPLHPSRAKYSRVNTNDGFQILITLQFEKSSLKKRNWLLLKAAGETEFNEWMMALSHCAKYDRLRVGTLSYWSFDARLNAVSKLNGNGDSALHCLAKCRKSKYHYVNEFDSDGDDYEERKPDQLAVKNMLTVAAWLVSSGCPLDTLNADKKTAYFVAVESQNFAMARLLQDMGANVHIPDGGGRSAHSLYPTELDQIENVERTHKIKVPKLLPFYTYACIHIQQQAKSSWFDSAAESLLRKQQFKMVPYTSLEDIHLTVEVYDISSRKMSEFVADIHQPVIVETDSIWWGRSCFLPTPLNFMKGSSLLVLKVRGSHVPDDEGEETQIIDLGWTYLNLDLTCIDTKMLRLQFFSGSFDYNLVAFNTASTIGTYLDIDFSLTKRGDVGTSDASSSSGPAKSGASNAGVIRGARRRYTVAPKSVSATSPVLADSSSALFGSSVVGENRSILQSPIRVPNPANPSQITPPRLVDDSPTRDESIPKRTVAFATPDSNEAPSQRPALEGHSKSTKKIINSVSGRHMLSEREVRTKGYVRINTREYVEKDGEDPALFLMQIPEGLQPGTVIVNLGGRRDRSLVIPRGVSGGDTVLVVAKK